MPRQSWANGKLERPHETRGGRKPEDELLYREMAGVDWIRDRIAAGIDDQRAAESEENLLPGIQL